MEIFISEIAAFNMCGQPWPTQIGSRATFLNNRHKGGQNCTFSKDFIGFAPKELFSETACGPGWPWLALAL